MKVINTEISDLFILEPKVFGDERGYFFESYNKMTLESLLGKNYNFVQDNESKSSYGVVRGLHYQLAPFSQTKLVRVLEGKVYDVAVDLRKDSPTFLKWVGVSLAIASPVGWMIMNRWLQNFAYHTNISWWIFALTLFIALLITFATVTWQSLKTARTNPVNALRFE